jgi:glutamate/tyrosine decarboxylase-like PLP-dependent enzyme
VIFRNKSDHQIIGQEAPYLEGLAPTIEGSRPGSPSAAAWVATQTLNRQGYRELIESQLRRAKSLAAKLSDANYQVLHTVDLNTVCFSIKKEGESRNQINGWNAALRKRVIEQGRFNINLMKDLAGIKVRNRMRESDYLVDIRALRMLVVNPFTTEDNIDSLLAELEYYRKKIVW